MLHHFYLSRPVTSCSLRKKARFIFFLFSFCVPVLAGAATEPTAETDSVRTDNFDIRDESFLLPQCLPPGHYTSALYLLNVYVPSDWTLDMIKAPMFCYAGKYTLTHSFNLQASLSTLFVSNRINMGPFWNYSLPRFHIGVGYQVAFNYGLLNQFGYSTTLTGWEQQASVTIGTNFKTMAVIVRGDLYYTNSLYLVEGENTIPFTEGFLNGYSVSCNLEQRLWKNRVMSIGLKWSYLRYHILAWPAFPVNRYRYDVPEFQIGLNF
jgi:hypothetical protein